MKTQILNFFKSSLEQFEAANFSELAWNHSENYKKFAGGDASLEGGYMKFVEKLADGLDFRL